MKGASSSSRTLSTFFSKMPAILKQLVKVLFERTCHDFVNMIMADRMDTADIGSFFSNAEISLPTASEPYLSLKARITPWSISWICDVVWGGRNISWIHSRFSAFGWAVQLSIIKAIFLFTKPNFWSSLLTQSSESFADIQLLRWARYRQGKCLTRLKQQSFWAFSMTSMWNLSHKAFPAAGRVRQTLLWSPPTSPPWAFISLKMYRLVCEILIEWHKFVCMKDVF